MSSETNASFDPHIGLRGQDKRSHRHHAVVTLNDEQLAAVEGWRTAHGIAAQSDALSELVRIGLLAEIAKIFRLVSDNRASPAAQACKTPDGQAGRDDSIKW